MDHRPHIVVVEDEAAQRQLLVDYLGRQNFRVSGADGGTALRKLLERELPSLVLLDVGLPGEDGFVLARSKAGGPLKLTRKDIEELKALIKDIERGR